jgi:formylglycine-generating enzyme required for sulfatase activity
MSHTAIAPNWGSVLLPAALLAGLAVILAGQTGLVAISGPGPSMSAPQTVVVASRSFEYRAAGDFVRNGAAVDGPLVEVAQAQPLEIMTYQVSATDYAICVADRACQKAQPRRRGTGNVAATGVSFDDATDYAAWLSARTGSLWRLPTIEEWIFAAGSKATDPALGADGVDIAERWLLAYEREAALGSDAVARPEPLGTFGANEFGLFDLSATVWEWTSTCAGRTTLDAGGRPVTQVESCGVRYLEGRHRTPMSAFVRDALGGACSAGFPPDNLGFRLVRERGWMERARETIAWWMA